MVSTSTLFHPIALELCVIPVAVGLGILFAWFSNKLVLGILTTMLILILFDLWFWRYFYESGMYAHKLYSIEYFIINGLLSAITWLISKFLLSKKRIKI